MSQSTKTTSQIRKNNAGLLPGLIACILALLGIFTLGVLFIPLAALVAVISTIIAIKNKSISGIGATILAWILTIVGLVLSPVLLALIGLH